MNKYQLVRTQLREKCESIDWSEIDKYLQDIPTDLYTFTPTPETTIFYKRLLHILTTPTPTGCSATTTASFHLSAYILSLNTNNYYALMLRSNSFLHKIIQQTDIQKRIRFVDEELCFTSGVLSVNPKEYQLWNYKKNLLRWAATYVSQDFQNTIIHHEEEFLFFLMTNDDQKNYHAWDYMTYLARIHGNLQLKFKETDSKLFLSINNDGINCESLWANSYSCWSYRFNLLMDLPSEQQKFYLQQDCTRVMNLLHKKINNECAWNYLSGLAEAEQLDKARREKLIDEVVQLSNSQDGKRCRFVWSFLLMNGNQVSKLQCIDKLRELDPIRETYYKFLMEQETQE